MRVGLREVTYAPEWVVLATGGFSAGGLELDSSWVTREVALGLPVAGAPAPGEERFRADYFGGQPMDRVGVRTDREQRPVGEDGDVWWRTYSWLAPRSPARCHGGRSRATGSPLPPASGRRS